MKAIDFIKEHGIDKAKKVIDGAPYLNSDETHFCADVFVYTDGFDDGGYCQHCVDLSDLKRLVESVDLIAYHGGINEAKEFLKCKSPNPKNNDGWHMFEQAIADYEQIFGGEHV